MADTDRLTDAERESLRLLVEGHTVKSIALELGVTQGAVNDRLRSARKKTGASSSRELARHLKEPDGGPHKIRTEKIGMAAARLPGQRKHIPTGRLYRWPIILGAFAVVTLAAGTGAFAALALALSSVSQPSPPHIVSTYPANDGQIEPGKLALSVTFDRAMSPASYSFIERDPSSWPACEKRPTQSPDGRTFTLLCVTQPRGTYVVGFNSTSHHNFTGASDRTPATPAVIRFSTR